MLRHNATLFLAIAVIAAGDCAAEPTGAIPPAAQRQIDFTRDVWPLFVDRCVSCHGEDDQKGQLRLDAKALVQRGGKSGPLFKSGDSRESLLLKRLVGIGGKRMPLDDEPLTDEQIGLIRAWIDHGAKWPDGLGSAATEIKKHWAYVAPQQPQPPALRDASWASNAIDAFALSRLESERISPSPPADRAQLVRRASLDLLGAPPSLAEVDAFIADKAPDAYDRLLDRLLTSPRYGERWTIAWLDAARYADSNGTSGRPPHDLAVPRLVIRALNRHALRPVHHRADCGDLLPKSTPTSKLPPSHRCTTVSVEAGTDEEEKQRNQVLDRVSVTGTVWLGTALNLSVPRSKYDPSHNATTISSLPLQQHAVRNLSADEARPRSISVDPK
jgi:mono/diheme cytochrome c family protein